MINLSSTYIGIAIKNPIVVGSSGLSSSIQGIKKLAEAGAGAIVLKSVFEEEIADQYNSAFNDNLAFQDSNLEFLDYYDYEIKKEVLVAYSNLIKDAKKEVSIPIIASINCVSVSEWLHYAVKLEEAGADGIELNIFKLPYDTKLSAVELEQLYIDIALKVKQAVNIPVGIKIAPNFSNLSEMAKRFADTGIDGIVMFNRFVDLDFDLEKELVYSEKVYSSDTEYHNTLRWVSLLSEQVMCGVVASTGVHNWGTAVKMLLAGADCVEVVSAIYKYGPEKIRDMVNGIEFWMESKGYQSIEDFKGKMAREKSENADVFERVQFMKYYSAHK